jgi:hypothetical protein
MKNLYYYGNKVIGYEDAVEGEIIGVGVGASVFTGSDKACRRKVAELGLDYEGFDLAPIAIPPCTPRQIRLWLLSMGITESMIEAQINQIEDPNDRAATLVEFKYASEFQRDHNFVTEIGLSLGLSEDEIDSGFKIAGSL